MDLMELYATLGLDTSEYESGLSGAEQTASSFGSKLGNSLGTAAKVGAAAMTAAVTAVGAVSAGLVKGAGDVASYGDNIDKMSQKIGISATAYQEWDAVMQHSGTSIDGMVRGMTTLSKAAEDGDEAFQALGISQEEIANMSQEELFARTIEGLQGMEAGSERTVLAQKLLGGSAKELGALLNTSAEETEEMKKRVHELGGVMSDEAVKAAAAYQDSLQDMQTAISGAKRGLLENLLPSLTTVMDGITNVFSGNQEGGLALVSEGLSSLVDSITEQIPQIIELGTTILDSFVVAITENLPTLIEALLPPIIQLAVDIITALITVLPEIVQTLIDLAPQIIMQIIEAVVAMLPEFINLGMQAIQSISQGTDEESPNLLSRITELILGLIQQIGEGLPQFLEKGSEIIINMINGFTEQLPSIVESIVSILMALIDTIVANLPLYLEKGGEIILSMISGIGNALPDIISKIAELLTYLIQTIVENLPEFISKGFELITSIISGIGDALPDIISAIWDMVVDIGETIMEMDWLSIGIDLIEGIVDGVVDAAWELADAALDAVKSAWNSMTSWLDINSPSRKARDQIGKMWARGIGIGFEQGMPVDDMVGVVEGAFDEVGDIEPPLFDSDNGLMVDKMTFDTGSDSVDGGYSPVTINVYGRDGQSAKEIAEEVQRQLALWERQRKAAYA